MPTYYCTSAQGRLSAEQKGRIANEITRIHAEVTGAPSYFAQVIFSEVAPGNWFMGGVPVAHDHIFVYGHIRSGRAAVDKTRMIKLMADAVGAAASVDSKRAVWVYLNELQPRQMIEFGHVLPEPGDEPAWTDALPEADRVFMQSITGRR
ncbi:tautomerase family protein [Bradyrhizobium sp. Pha-3]|uniref:tautomerase family protein n=1 Tax=Bradyrhizobium sp. Pha-3 TaxID=208375 RepID=UPI0035D3E480